MTCYIPSHIAGIHVADSISYKESLGETSCAVELAGGRTDYLSRNLFIVSLESMESITEVKLAVKVNFTSIFIF